MVDGQMGEDCPHLIGREILGFVHNHHVVSLARCRDCGQRDVVPVRLVVLRLPLFVRSNDLGEQSCAHRPRHRRGSAAPGTLHANVGWPVLTLKTANDVLHFVDEVRQIRGHCRYSHFAEEPLEDRPTAAVAHNIEGANKGLGPSTERINCEVNALRVRGSALVDELSDIGPQSAIECQHQHADMVVQAQPRIAVDARCAELPQPQQGYGCLAAACRTANQPETYSVIG